MGFLSFCFFCLTHFFDQYVLFECKAFDERRIFFVISEIDYTVFFHVDEDPVGVIPNIFMELAKFPSTHAFEYEIIKIIFFNEFFESYLRTESVDVLAIKFIAVDGGSAIYKNLFTRPPSKYEISSDSHVVENPAVYFIFFEEIHHFLWSEEACLSNSSIFDSALTYQKGKPNCNAVYRYKRLRQLGIAIDR